MNNVIVKYKNEEINDNECFNNNQNECMTCSDNDNLVLMENNFCPCFKYVVFCESCFISWLLKHHKCIICRKKFEDENRSIFDIFDILNIEIYQKILFKLENMRSTMSSVSRLQQNNRHIIRNLPTNQPNQNVTPEYILYFKNAYYYYSFLVLYLYMSFIGTFTTFCYIFNIYIY